MKLSGVGEVHLTSPRAGIIQVGPALFDRFITPKNQKSIANSIARLKTLFHEARHSDGNGKSLAFYHAACPANHDLAGYLSCDRNLNGPYTIGATIEQAMTESCESCTVGEREALRLAYLESFGRVIQISKNGVRSTRWDPKPEGMRQ